MIVSVGEEDVQIEAIVDQVARLRKLGDMQDWEEIEGTSFRNRILSGLLIDYFHDLVSLLLLSFDVFIICRSGSAIYGGC